MRPTDPIVALIAGFVSFLAPCVLPLVPGYLSAISAVEADRLGDKGSARRVMLASIPFVLGFTLVFVSLGVGAQLIGAENVVFRAQRAQPPHHAALIGVVRREEGREDDDDQHDEQHRGAADGHGVTLQAFPDARPIALGTDDGGFRLCGGGIAGCNGRQAR